MYLCCRIARRQFEHSFQPTVHAISDDAKPYVPRNYSVWINTRLFHKPSRTNFFPQPLQQQEANLLQWHTYRSQRFREVDFRREFAFEHLRANFQVLQFVLAPLSRVLVASGARLGLVHFVLQFLLLGHQDPDRLHLRLHRKRARVSFFFGARTVDAQRIR